MADAPNDLNYPVLVIERAGGFELRIQELLLRVYGADLKQAYAQLLQRKQEVLDLARSVGAFDEIPPPTSPPLLGASLLQSAKPRQIV